MQPDQQYRRILWIALSLNLALLVIELTGGWHSGSVSLWADAIDFAGDAANYGLSLAVFSMAVDHRNRLAAFKGICMALFGVVVLGKAVWATVHGTTPEASTMGIIAVLAMTANLAVAWMLYRYRNGDADMRSVWLCSRNDALGNLAVLAAAAGVFGTSTKWPDLLVAVSMGGLALWSGISVIKASKLSPGLANPS